MVKNYVIDTNVLIQAPDALRCFEDNMNIPDGITPIVRRQETAFDLT